jgi:Carbon dioxide concentrating mechanism/carboxysome shell protein
MQSIGMIETKGMVAAIEAADTMLKSADVSLFYKEKIGGGRVTVLIKGDIGAVQAAIDAGVVAIEHLNTKCLLSSHVIPRPHTETMELFGKTEIRAKIQPVEMLPIEKIEKTEIVEMKNEKKQKKE